MTAGITFIHYSTAAIAPHLHPAISMCVMSCVDVTEHALRSRQCVVGEFREVMRRHSYTVCACVRLCVRACVGHNNAVV